MRPAIYIAACLLFISSYPLSTGCKKKELLCKCAAPPPIKKEATIVFTGMVEADGCDWLIEVEPQVFYRADSLPASFKENNLRVTISYYITDKEYTCGWNRKLPIIHVVDMKKI